MTDDSIAGLHDEAIEALQEGDLGRAADLASRLADLVTGETDTAAADGLGWDMVSFYSDTAAFLDAYGEFARMVGARIRAAPFSLFYIERATKGGGPAADRLADLQMARTVGLPADDPDLADEVTCAEGVCLIELGRIDDGLQLLSRIDLRRSTASTAEAVAIAMAGVLMVRGEFEAAAKITSEAVATCDRAQQPPSAALGAATVTAHLGGMSARSSAASPDTLSTLERFAPNAANAGISPTQVTLVAAVEWLQRHDLDHAGTLLGSVAGMIGTEGGTPRAWYAVATAKLAMLRGDVVAATPLVGHAGPLVDQFGDESLRLVYASLLESLRLIGNPHTDPSPAARRLTNADGAIGRATAAALDARRRLLSGAPQPGLWQDLLAESELLGPEEEHIYLSLLFLAAVAVGACDPPRTTQEMNDLVRRSDDILIRIVDHVDQVHGPDALVSARVFAAAGRSWNKAIVGFPVPAMAELARLHQQLRVAGATVFVLAVARLQMAVANLVDDHREVLRLTVEILDYIQQMETAKTSAEDRARHAEWVSDCLHDAVSAAVAVGDQQAIAGLLEQVRAQEIPVAVTSPRDDQSPLSALMQLVGDTPEAPVAPIPVGAMPGSASGPEPVTLLGTPPMIMMPWGEVALAGYRSAPLGSARHVRLTVIR